MRADEPQGGLGDRLVEQHLLGSIIGLDDRPRADALIVGELSEPLRGVGIVVRRGNAQQLDRNLSTAGELDCVGKGLLALRREIDRNDNVVEHDGLLSAPQV